LDASFWRYANRDTHRHAGLLIVVSGVTNWEGRAERKKAVASGAQQARGAIQPHLNIFRLANKRV